MDEEITIPQLLAKLTLIELRQLGIRDLDLSILRDAVAFRINDRGAAILFEDERIEFILSGDIENNWIRGAMQFDIAKPGTDPEQLARELVSRIYKVANG